MSFLGKLNVCALLLLTLITLNGCSPSGSSQTDDEKEPHYLLGKSRVSAMDYTGAIKAFKEALQVNPQSAAAHFQLACIYDTDESDPAAAIYHYREYLRLDPHAANAEVIRQRIYSCKQQLAADVMPLPSTPAAQQQIEKLADQNRQLQAEVTHLQTVIKQWNTYYLARQKAARSQVSASPTSSLPSRHNATPENVAATTSDHFSAAPAPSTSRAGERTAPHRTHKVKAGETMAAIAREYGVSLAAMRAANPGVVPRKLRVGQVLNVPE